MFWKMRIKIIVHSFIFGIFICSKICLSDKVGQELLFSLLTLSFYFSDLSREVLLHHAILSVNGSVPGLELLAAGFAGSLVLGVPVGDIGVDLIVGEGAPGVVVSQAVSFVFGTPVGIELASHVFADTTVLSNPLDVFEEGLVVVLGLLDSVLLVGVEGEEIVAHGLPAGASHLAGDTGELSERVGFTSVSGKDPLVLAIGVGVVGGLLFSHLEDGLGVVGFQSALSELGIVRSNESVEVSSDFSQVSCRSPESLPESISLGTVPAGQKGTLFNIGGLGIHGASNLTDLSLGQIKVSGVAAVGVSDAGGVQLAVFVLDGFDVSGFQVVVQVVELELGDPGIFHFAGSGLINQVNTEVAFLNPIGFDSSAGGADGLGVELEEGGAHIGAALDFSHPAALVSLLAGTSVRDVVGSTDFETDIAFNAEKLLLLGLGSFAVSKQVVLVLELGSNPVLVLLDSIVSLDSQVAGLTVEVQSSGDLLGVADALSFSDGSESHNGGSD